VESNLKTKSFRLNRTTDTFQDVETREITIRNNGADDKFSILISIGTVDGQSYDIELADQLNKGDSLKADIRDKTFKINRAQVLSRDKNGIGRYTCLAQAEPDKVFPSLICWWISDRDETVESNFMFGTTY
jgi:hypothetical protein